MQIALIVAAAENGVIGRRGDLPWRLSDDLRRFKKLTMGSPILMGRKTYESIGRPLPGRRSIVLTHQPDYAAPDEVVVVSNWDDALDACAPAEQAFVIGGEQLYRTALPHADRLYLTRVRAHVEGDAFFPELEETKWREVERQEQPADDRNELPSTFVVLQRVGADSGVSPADNSSRRNETVDDGSRNP